MLQIGSPKIKAIQAKIDDQTIDGIHFKVRKAMGFTIQVAHDAENDEKAKAVLKKAIAAIPEAKNVYTNIQYIDEKGHIL